MMAHVGGQGVPDTESATLERLEHQLERFAYVEMEEDLETARPEWLHARDDRISGIQPAGALVGFLRANPR